MKKLFLVIFSSLFIFCSVLIADDSNLELGNPTNAIQNIQSNRNYLIEREQYALSYDNESGIPNWVSWHLSKEDMGDVKRTNYFYTDTSLQLGGIRLNIAIILMVVLIGDICALPLIGQILLKTIKLHLL